MTALYKSLVAPSHKNCELIEQAVQEYMTKAHRIFGAHAMRKVSSVLIEYFAKGKCAAIATHGKLREDGKGVGLIQFSMHLVVKRLFTMIKQIVPHELAHIICIANKWDFGHGRMWRQVCMMLGGNGQTFHTMEASDGRYKNAYEALGEEGHVYWLTSAQRKVAASAGLRALTHDGREITLTGKSLTGNMKRL